MNKKIIFVLVVGLCLAYVSGLSPEFLLEKVAGFGWDSFDISDSGIDSFLSDNGGMKFEVVSEGGFFSYQDENGVVREFKNIVPSSEGVKAEINFDKMGNVASADFFTNDEGGTYIFNDVEVVAPANTHVLYDSEFGNVNLELADGVELDKDFGVFNEGAEGNVFVRGKNVVLPNGEVLEEGVLGFNENGYFVPKGESVEISGYKLNAISDDICLFRKCEGYYFLKEGNNFVFSGKTLSFDSSMDYFIEDDFSDSVNKGFYQIGDEGDKIPFYKDLLGVSNDNNVYDRELFEAVKGYQAEQGLKVDGLLGPETYNSLKETYGSNLENFIVNSNNAEVNYLDGNVFQTNLFGDAGFSSVDFSGGEVVVRDINGNAEILRKAVRGNEGVPFRIEVGDETYGRMEAFDDTVFTKGVEGNFDESYVEDVVFDSMTSKSGQCGVGARQIIEEVTGMSNEEFGEVFNGAYGFNAWDVERKTIEGGGFTLSDKFDIQKGDLVTFSRDGGRTTHVGVVLSSDGETVRFAHQYGSVRRIDSLDLASSDWKSYAGYKFHRPNYPEKYISFEEPNIVKMLGLRMV